MSASIMDSHDFICNEMHDVEIVGDATPLPVKASQQVSGPVCTGFCSPPEAVDTREVVCGRISVWKTDG